VIVLACHLLDSAARFAHPCSAQAFFCGTQSTQ
jgi:hypothetical protein